MPFLSPNTYKLKVYDLFLVNVLCRTDSRKTLLFHKQSLKLLFQFAGAYILLSTELLENKLSVFPYDLDKRMKVPRPKRGQTESTTNLIGTS